MSKIKPLGTRLSVNEGLVPIPSYKEWKSNSRFSQSGKITIEQDDLLQGWYFDTKKGLDTLKSEEFDFTDDTRKPVAAGDYILGESDTDYAILKAMDGELVYVAKRYELEQVKQKI